ncbi:MAG: hypothetical protein WBP64_01540, partial [Nitrososphaeraceae archaeon]
FWDRFLVYYSMPIITISTCIIFFGRTPKFFDISLNIAGILFILHNHRNLAAIIDDEILS